MDELRSILDTWFSLEGENQDAVLATVVHVKGSAYRRPGARMLLIPDGRRIGSISGGCLEGEISRKAWWFTAGGTPVVRVYDTTSDDDAVWEFGLGCNGIVQVMLERADSPSARAFFQFLSQNPSAQPASSQDESCPTCGSVKSLQNEDSVLVCVACGYVMSEVCLVNVLFDKCGDMYIPPGTSDYDTGSTYFPRQKMRRHKYERRSETTKRV